MASPDHHVTFVTGKTGPVGPEGPEGPEGPRGPAGADGTGQPYIHDQDVAAATWSIGHNFGRRVSVTILNDEDEIVFADVVETDLNTTTIIFPTPFAGMAVII